MKTLDIFVGWDNASQTIYLDTSRGYVEVKIYLSPADHDYTNICSYDSTCSENKHCNEYMDILQNYLMNCGFQIKRRPRVNGGKPEYNLRIAEANAWPADLYYVCHTNGSDGTHRGSTSYVNPNDVTAIKWAGKILEWRKKIYTAGTMGVYTSTELLEINATNMPCVYEELLFHDNIDDATFLHTHMALLAEYTARALCEIFQIPFKQLQKI